MTYSISVLLKRSLVFPVLALTLIGISLVLFPIGVAHADNVVTQTSTLQFNAGGNAVGSWKLVATSANQPGGDPVSGCNANTTNPVHVTPSSTAGLVINPTSFDFTNCNANQPQSVTFSSNTSGTYVVTVVASGGISGGSYQTQPSTITVTVIGDAIKPVIAAHANVLASATSAAGATVSYTSPATSDNVDAPGVATCLPASGTVFAIGTTLVTCNASDTAGNPAISTTFNVTIEDDEDPVVTVPSNIQQSASSTHTTDGGTAVTFADATATDNVGVTSGPTCDATSGSLFALGITTVTCTATDAAGKIGSNTFNVNIVDDEDPVVTVPTKVRIGIPSGDSNGIVTYSVTATDNVGVTSGPTCDAPSGSLFTAGNTTVTCTAGDAALNSGSNSFNVLVGRVNIINDTPNQYSTIWNRTIDLKINVIGYELDDKLEIKRGATSLANIITTPGDSDTDTTFTVTLPKFSSADSGPTPVDVTAVLVEALGDTANFGTDSTGIKVNPHATSITTSTFSDGFPGNSASEIGTISDTDDSVQVTGLPITFSVNPANGISGLPATTSSGITITDNSVLSIASNNLLVHTDTTITNPSFYQADITFTGLVSGDQLEFVLTPVSGALTPNTQIWTVPTTGDITIPLYFGGGDLIKEIKITKLPNTTASISNIVIRNSPGDIVHDISFTGSLDSGVTTITENLGRFSSNGTLVSSGVFIVTASYNGSNLAYSASSAPATEFNTQSGVGGSATITADSGMGIAAVACTADGDKDYLCDSWEGSAATDGIPFVVTNYVTGTPTTFYYKLPTSSKTVKDLYVESDYMTGHTPDANAVLDVKNLFGTKSIVLHHTIDQVIPHSSFTALWGDTNMVIGDDFNSLKMAYFGSATEHPTLGGTVTVTCTDCATSASSHTLKISGITLQTPSTALTGSTTSGKVTVKATVTLLTGTTAVVHKITSPSVAGTNAAVKIGPLTTSDLTVTGSGAAKTFTITVPFSTVAATGSLVNLGDITIPFTTKATADVASTLTVTTASFATAGSPRINTSLTDAIAQGVHYIPWIHTIGTSTTACGPSGQSELPGNDGVVSLGCNFATAESGFAYPTGDTRKATVGDRQQQAGTFLHELAHNMGINHGGPQTLLVATTQTNPDATTTTFAAGTSPADSTVNCKPQYTSVMSYARQFPSYLSLAEWVLNLSSGGHSALKESALVETTPVAGTAATLVWGTPTTSPTTLFKKGSSGVGSDWNNNAAVSGTVSADINNLGINGCNTASISTAASYDWNDWANLDFNLRKATGGQLDGLLGEETPEVVKQATIFSSKFDGFSNPPPYDDASKNLVSAATTPLKIKILSQTGDTLVVKLRGEYRLSTATTPSNTYTKMVCNNNAGKDTFVLKDTFNQCDWKVPSAAKGTKIFIKVWLDTAGGTPPEILLVDQSPPVPTPAGGFPYKDLQGNIVTNYVKIK